MNEVIAFRWPSDSNILLKMNIGIMDLFLFIKFRFMQKHSENVSERKKINMTL